MPAASLPLSELSWVIEEWLKSKIEAEEPDWFTITYALETAELIDLHCSGQGQQDRWEVAPLLDESLLGHDVTLLRFMDSGFKRRVTQVIQNQIVCAQVPADSKIIDVHGKEIPLLENRSLFIVVRRCHMSQWPVMERIAHVEGPKPPGPVFGDRIHILGDLVLDLPPEELAKIRWYMADDNRGIAAEVPAAWAVQTVRLGAGRKGTRLVPVPKWPAPAES